MMNDNVNHPSHYTAGGIECIDALKAATEGLEGIQAVCTANAIKYLWRWKRKNGAEDLKKAKWYIDRLLKETETPAEEPRIDTCRERLQKEHPEYVGEDYWGGCKSCPFEYGYAGRSESCRVIDGDDDTVCRECWSRPAENKEEAENGQTARLGDRNEPQNEEMEK